MKILKYMKLNVSNVMDTLDMAKSFNRVTEFFENKDGEIHKVAIIYGPCSMDNSTSIYEFTVNDVEMGGNYENMGDAYDFIMRCCG